jgi:Holliday junction resolvase RusA-like endonuclease
VRAAIPGAKRKRVRVQPVPDPDAPGIATLATLGRVVVVVPGVARGWQRTGATIRGGEGKPFVSLYTKHTTRAAEAHVAACALAQAGRLVLSGPVAMTLNVDVEPPKSWPKWRVAAALRGEVFPTGKPDFDNVLKLVCDALNGIIWADDAQIVTATFAKRYAPEPSTRLVVRPLPTPTRQTPTQRFLDGLE